MRTIAAGEANITISEELQAAGIDVTDPILKTPAAELVCSPGAVTEITENEGRLVYQLPVSYTITFRKVFEVVVNDKDEITHKPL